MKIDKIYYFNDEKNPVVLYEFANKAECNNVMKLIDQRNNRQTCFMSGNKYYAGEYITEDIAKFLINHNKVYSMDKAKGCNWNDFEMFYVDMDAYGETRYYFNNNTKQFYHQRFSMGD